MTPRLPQLSSQSLRNQDWSEHLLDHVNRLYHPVVKALLDQDVSPPSVA
jgi:hypothetical protein